MRYDYNLSTRVFDTVSPRPPSGNAPITISVTSAQTPVDFPSGGRVTTAHFTTGPGKVKNRTDPLGRRTDFTDTDGDQGFVRTLTDPLGRTTTYSYDLPGGACGCAHRQAAPHPDHVAQRQTSGDHV